MTPDSSPPIPPAPISDPVSTAPVTHPASIAPVTRSVPWWRWLVFTVIIACFPLMATLSSVLASRSGVKHQPPALPSEPVALVIATSIELGLLGVFWLLAWFWARPNREQLWLPWRGGFNVVGWGVLYSLGLRLAVAAAALVGLTVAVMVGFTAKQVTDFFLHNQPDIGSLIDQKAMVSNPLYALVMLTWVSFVVAGLREELWRAATVCGLLHLFPQRMSQSAKNVFAVVISAAIFGVGHLRQGWLACAFIFILGCCLGAILLRHRSIWPAVIAHGLFDAGSFLAASQMLGHK